MINQRFADRTAEMIALEGEVRKALVPKVAAKQLETEKAKNRQELTEKEEEEAFLKGFNYDDEDEEIVVEEIGRSVGAKARNYDVYNPLTGEYVHLTEGTRITQPKNHIIAGKGRNRQIDELENLLDNYGGSPLEWTKEKGFGYVDIDGESYYVELHWYQEPSVGKVRMKIKIQPDGGIFLGD